MAHNALVFLKNSFISVNKLCFTCGYQKNEYLFHFIIKWRRGISMIFWKPEFGMSYMKSYELMMTSPQQFESSIIFQSDRFRIIFIILALKLRLFLRALHSITTSYFFFFYYSSLDPFPSSNFASTPNPNLLEHAPPSTKVAQLLHYLLLK